MPADEVGRALDAAYRDERAAILATLVRQVGGDLALAEDAVQDAFLAAVTAWGRDGVPTRPGAWLTVAARRRAVDRLRREHTRRTKQPLLDALHRLEEDDGGPASSGPAVVAQPIVDDRLRLIFTCCHPALAPEVRVALTLRTLAGLEVSEIARAFLTTETTMYQRLVRAKRKILAAGIPYEVPPPDRLPERLSGVLRVVYLTYNEGHTPTGSPNGERGIAAEAIRLGRLLHDLVPDEPEVAGLLSLMLSTEARRPARTGPDGAPIALDEQDRGRWDPDLLAEGARLVQEALAVGRAGPYQLQAAIAAVHGEAASFADTDWAQIAALYDLLGEVDPSPVVAINRAVAIAYVDGPTAGLVALAPLVGDARLVRYQPLHAARAELLRRAGDHDAARSAYDTAIDLTDNPVERSGLVMRRDELGPSGPRK